MRNASKFEEIARRRLPAEVAERWISLLRPGIRLKHAATGDTVVGRLGGDAPLADDEAWPQAPDGTPLNHVMTVELARLPHIELDLPRDGRLSFYCAAAEGTHGVVQYQASRRPAGSRPDPPEVAAGKYNHVELMAELEMTAPDYGHSYLHNLENIPAEGSAEYEEYMDCPAPFDDDEFRAVVSRLPIPTHRIGGYGRAVQYTCDNAPIAGPMTVPEVDGPVVDTELPLLLAQIDTDARAGLGWGDMGISLWMISRADLAARRFEDVDFSWSCH